VISLVTRKYLSKGQQGSARAFFRGIDTFIGTVIFSYLIEVLEQCYPFSIRSRFRVSIDKKSELTHGFRPGPVVNHAVSPYHYSEVIHGGTAHAISMTPKSALPEKMIPRGFSLFVSNKSLRISPTIKRGVRIFHLSEGLHSLIECLVGSNQESFLPGEEGSSVSDDLPERPIVILVGRSFVAHGCRSFAVAGIHPCQPFERIGDGL